jgi:3-hydroxyisobutyrate dehydrogenase-like beta-hydroxyacid dehydrogenase
VIGAEKGTLTFMVGGESDDFKIVEPILAKMGKNIVHVGPMVMDLPRRFRIIYLQLSGNHR